jgi:hypothetical protein
MIPTQDHPGQCWRSSDAADIWLNESGTEVPTAITCQTPQGGAAIVRVDDLKFIGAGLFGEGRPCLGGNAKWTGNSYRYGVYECSKAYSGRAIVILQSSGGGMEGLLLSSTTTAETWQHLAANSKTEMLWNICHELYDLRREALEGVKRSIFAAFIEGRLKKSRKRKGVISVSIEAAA